MYINYNWKKNKPLKMTSKFITIKFFKTSNKEKSLKSSQKNRRHVTYGKIKVQITDFLSKKVQGGVGDIRGLTGNGKI